MKYMFVLMLYSAGALAEHLGFVPPVHQELRPMQSVQKVEKFCYKVGTGTNCYFMITYGH